MKLIRLLLLAFCITISCSISYADPTMVTLPEFAKIQGMNLNALTLGMRAYACAMKRGYIHTPMLTIVDFTKPSTQKRLWVINMDEHRVLYKLYVTHGKNSGDIYPTRFSNKVDSLESSLGAYLTENTYDGDYGYSLVLHGLEPGINDNAEIRHIILHQAWYATGSTVKKYHELGLSWGCFAIDPAVAKDVINTVKDQSLLFAYAPSENNDKFILDC